MRAPHQIQDLVTVTKPSLPPIEDFIPLLRQIWDSKVLTNAGPFHNKLEKALTSYLQVPEISLFTNATIALVCALQALRITGEVLTTPYSFVATSHALLWNNIKPVFVDIDPTTLNIDHSKIESAITPQTTAILAVHCYGQPCNIAAIEQVAERYNLRVIYDAAHAFGVSTSEAPILSAGDLSVLSFHATKVFQTFEGGAIISGNAKMKKRIDYLKNFGFADEVTVVAPGINGKMSEFNAAVGLLQLEHFEEYRRARKAIFETYVNELSDLKTIEVVGTRWTHNSNYGYFPILVSRDAPITRDELYTQLRDAGYHARRYFYPLISDMPMYRGLASSRPENLPISRDISSRVLCLPIFEGLPQSTVAHICSTIRNAMT
jgi:dTDP-4-amino-4,6-dideoxygalactose transaminase